jgi:hypothetical protein
MQRFTALNCCETVRGSVRLVVRFCFGRQPYSFLDGSIKVEARIDAECGAVIEKAAAGTFRLREDYVSLRECKIRERCGEQIAGLRREASNVLGASSGTAKTWLCNGTSAKRGSFLSGLSACDAT